MYTQEKGDKEEEEEDPLKEERERDGEKIATVTVEKGSLTFLVQPGTGSSVDHLDTNRRPDERGGRSQYDIVFAPSEPAQS